MSVSLSPPSLILSPLRSFTLADGGQLYWEMGENLYTINGSLLSALNGSIADFDDAVPLDSNTLDPNTEVYTRGSGSSAQLVVRYPIGIHELYLIEVLPNGPHSADHLRVGAAPHQPDSHPAAGLLTGVPAAPDDRPPDLGAAEPH